MQDFVQFQELVLKDLMMMIDELQNWLMNYLLTNRIQVLKVQYQNLLINLEVLLNYTNSDIVMLRIVNMLVELLKIRINIKLKQMNLQQNGEIRAYLNR
jgi:hypothetical protein